MASQWHEDVTGFCVYGHILLSRQLYEIMINDILLLNSPVCCVLLDSRYLTPNGWFSLYDLRRVCVGMVRS
jgi:hypothetical protein